MEVSSVYLHGELDELHELGQLGDLVDLPVALLHVEPALADIQQAAADRRAQGV